MQDSGRAYDVESITRPSPTLLAGENVRNMVSNPSLDWRITNAYKGGRSCFMDIRGKTKHT